MKMGVYIYSENNPPYWRLFLVKTITNVTLKGSRILAMGVAKRNPWSMMSQILSSPEMGAGMQPLNTLHPFRVPDYSDLVPRVPLRSTLG